MSISHAVIATSLLETSELLFPPHNSQWQAAKCRNVNTVTNQRSATHAHLFIFIAVDKFILTCSFAWGNRLNTSAARLVNWNNKVLSLKLDQKRSWNIRRFSCHWKQSTPCKVRTSNYVFNDFLNCLFTPAFSTWNERPEKLLHNKLSLLRHTWRKIIKLSWFLSNGKKISNQCVEKCIIRRLRFFFQASLMFKACFWHHRLVLILVCSRHQRKLWGGCLLKTWLKSVENKASRKRFYLY